VAREKRLARKPGYERLEREPDLDRPRGRPARSALLIERDVRIDLTSVRCQVYPDGMDYTHGMLARLAHADAACELSERLGAQADPSSDSYGQGAFLTEEAQSIYSEPIAFAERLGPTSVRRWGSLGSQLMSVSRKPNANSGRLSCSRIATPRRAAWAIQSHRTPKSPTVFANASIVGLSSAGAAPILVATSSRRSRKASGRCATAGRSIEWERYFSSAKP
jgi:hypothetical protein